MMVIDRVEMSGCEIALLLTLLVYSIPRSTCKGCHVIMHHVPYVPVSPGTIGRVWY